MPWSSQLRAATKAALMGRGQERRGDVIGDPWRQRRREDQRGERQAIGDRDGAGNESGKNVFGESRNLSSYWASVGSGCIIDGHANEPFNVSTLIVFTLLWRDSAGDASFRGMTVC